MVCHYLLKSFLVFALLTKIHLHAADSSNVDFFQIRFGNHNGDLIITVRNHQVKAYLLTRSLMELSVEKLATFMTSQDPQ